MNSLPLILAFVLAFLSLTPPLLAQATVPPRAMTSQEWMTLLVAANRSRRNQNESAADTFHRAAMNLATAAQKQQSSTSSAQNPNDTTQMSIVSVLLLWYSTEIRTEFKRPQDRADWQKERIILSAGCLALKQQYGEAVTESWRALNSAGHTLGLPQGAFPD